MRYSGKGFLTQEQEELLLREQRLERDARIKDRCRAILLLNKGWSYDQIAEALFLDHTTIRRYYTTYVEEGLEGLVLLAYKGKVSSLSEAQEELLKEHLREKTYLSAAKIAAYIQATFSVSYSVKGTVKLLHRIGFSYKKPKQIPGKADSKKQEEFLEDFHSFLEKKPDDEPVYFMDGVHPQHNSRPAYGWIEKGQTKELPTNTGRSRVNINGALNAEDLTVEVREDKSINADSTISLLSQLEEKHPESPFIHVFLDNAGYYKSKKVKEYLETSRVKLHFLPPYSPNLNLIERLWRFMHKKVTYNAYYERFDHFKKAIMDFFKNLACYENELKTLLAMNFCVINSQTQVA